MKRSKTRRRLILTTDPGNVSCVCHLHMETVQYLAGESIANQILTQVDLSRITESVRFGDDYLRLIRKYFFAFAPPVVYGLRCCRTRDMVVHASTLALVVPISRDTPAEHRHDNPYPSFILEFLQLPFGVTFAYVMADMHMIISRHTTGAWTEWSYGVPRPVRFHIGTQTIIHIAPALSKSATNDRTRRNRRAMNIIKISKLGE
jgi:hypothetical protein